MKKIDFKKDLFILGRIILSNIEALLYSVLTGVAALTMIVVVYSLSKKVSIIDTFSDVYHLLFEKEANPEMLAIYLFSMLCYGAIMITYTLILHFQLKKRIGAGLIAVTKWYLFYMMIYAILENILQKMGVLARLVSTNVFLEGCVLIILCVPPFLSTLSSIKKRDDFKSIYEQYSKSRLEAKNARDAERERIINQKLTDERNRLAVELQAKASAFNEEIERKTQLVIIPEEDNDDMI